METQIQKYLTNSSTETQQLAAQLAQSIHSQHVIALTGDLGSGKTTFAQGFAQGLGVQGRIISPTFIIIRRYPISHSTKYFYHIDLYRLDEIDLDNLGLRELLADPDSLVLIEWAEKIQQYLPKETIWINLKLLSDNQREITIQGYSGILKLDPK